MVTTQKTIRNRNRQGTLWVRKVDGQHFQVWFKTNDEYSAAFNRSAPTVKKREKKGEKGS